MSAPLESAKVGVVGTGVMGAGIAQVAAMAGHEVLMQDTRDGAADQARERIAASLGRQASKGRIGGADADAALGRLSVAGSVRELADCGLVIEAIAEELEAKAELFRQLETACGEDAVLATNTSALPIEDIGARLRRPGRLAGLHFFNPPTAMKLVEVVRHDAIDEGLAERLTALMASWGKEPIVAASSPGFVANRISRPFFIEALRLHEEHGVGFEAIDDCVRCCAGFRMGPFRLMDLIGNDVNSTNNAGIHEALGDPRIEPGTLQARMAKAGRLGVKSGSGFYDYGDKGQKTRDDGEAMADGKWPAVEGLVASDGTRASDIGGEVAVRDWCLPGKLPRSVAVTFSDGCGEGFRSRVLQSLADAKVECREVPDTPGLVVLRILVALVAVAADALAGKVATLPDMDKAMRLGMNHPHGPGGWLGMIGAETVSRTLAALSAGAPEGRYAPCDLKAFAG